MPGNGNLSWTSNTICVCVCVMVAVYVFLIKHLLSLSFHNVDTQVSTPTYSCVVV